MSRWKPIPACRDCENSPRDLCTRHRLEKYERSAGNKADIRWMRYKNGDYGDGNPTQRRARWEMKADALLDQMSPADWGEDFATAWAIATEVGRSCGLEPVVMRLNEREWRRLQKTAPGFVEAPIRLSEEQISPEVKRLFQQDYLGYHLVICLLKSNRTQSPS